MWFYKWIIGHPSSSTHTLKAVYLPYPEKTLVNYFSRGGGDDDDNDDDGEEKEINGKVEKKKKRKLYKNENF